MDFDELIERRGTHSEKWDMMQATYGVSPDDGLPMWVADMDFRPPACVQAVVEGMARHGVYGYFGDFRAYRKAIVWWMQARHGWSVDPAAVFTTHGLVHGTATCIEAFTRPGDGVMVFTPVYHAFARIIRASGRRVVECPLVLHEGRYVMDMGAAAAAARDARMVILCSPHNPGGRVWEGDELRALADLARAQDLILISDEIHHDLVMPGQRHIPMPVAAPDIADRLVVLTATTKTFNIAGCHTGNVIIQDPSLHAGFAARILANGISPNAFGIHMATAAYSPEGAQWVDALNLYLDGNRKLFDAGIAAIPGLASMPLEATYLAWVDFTGTGMAPAEFTRRVERDAGIAASHGATFGRGGERFLRFNFATPRQRVAESITRLQRAFGDLQ